MARLFVALMNIDPTRFSSVSAGGFDTFRDAVQQGDAALEHDKYQDDGNIGQFQAGATHAHKLSGTNRTKNTVVRVDATGFAPGVTHPLGTLAPSYTTAALGDGSTISVYDLTV